MAKLSIVKGATSVLVRIFIQDSSSTTGAGLTGLVFNSSGLKCYRMRDDDGNAGGTAITLATATKGTWASGGFVEKDQTNCAGWYEFGIPNAALASGSRSVDFHFFGATNMAPCPVEIELTGTDNQDGVHGGMSALPNTACASNASLLTIGTGTAQINAASGKVPATLASGDVTGNVACDVQTIKTQTVTCSAGVTVGAFVGNATAALSVDASGRVDVGKTLGNAVTLDANNVLNVSAKYLAGTALTGRDIGASVLLSAGTGTGQLDFTTGVVKANATQFAGQAITCSGGVTIPAATLASTTNITAGTITTATNLTNAPTSGDFTATMKTSLNAATPASVTGAVGSVTGNVGGNVVGSVGSVAAGGIDSTAFTAALLATLTRNLVLTGTTTPATADTYVPLGLYNLRHYYKSTTLGTAQYVWYSGGVWTISGTLGTNGSAYFTITDPTPDGTYTAQGTATGSPVSSIGGGQWLAGNQQDVTFNSLTVTNNVAIGGGLGATNTPGLQINGGGNKPAILAVGGTSSGTPAVQIQAGASVGNCDAIQLSTRGTGYGINGTLSNLAAINGVSASALTTINANLGTTQPVGFTGTGASALVKSDAQDIAGSATAATNLAAEAQAVFLGVVSSDATPTTTSFTANTTGSPGLSTTSGFYGSSASSPGSVVAFYSGNDLPKVAKITGYSYSAGVGTFTVEALPVAPAAADKFIVIGRAG